MKFSKTAADIELDMRLVKLNTYLGNFGTVPYKMREQLGFSALLVRWPATRHIPEIDSDHWRPNPKGFLVGGAALPFSNLISISAKIGDLGAKLGLEHQVTLPVFGQGGQRLIQDKKSFFLSNGVKTFFTWEESFGMARLYIANVENGGLISVDNDDLIDWSHHGMVFVTPGQYPLSLSMSLSI